MESGPRHYLDKLASLRFFAAFLVVLFHLGRVITQQNSFVAAICTPIAAYGYVGVSIFFVLSGFVISLANERWRGWNIYLSGRITRIYPPHLIVTLALFMPTVIALASAGADGWLKLITNLGLIQAWVPNTGYYRSLNLVTWSLSVEMSFYVAFLALRHLSNHWLFALTAVAYVTLIAFTFHLHHRWTFEVYWKLYINPVVRMPEFLAGMSVYRLYRTGQLPRLWLTRFNFPLILAALLLTMYEVGAHSGMGTSFAEPWDYSVVPLPFIVLLMVALLDESSNPWMHSRLLVLLGESSFALYLIHRPLIGYLHQTIGNSANPGLALKALILALSIIIPVGISVLFYKLVELPVTHAFRHRLQPAT